MSEWLYQNETLERYLNDTQDFTCTEGYNKFEDEINNSTLENDGFIEKLAKKPRGFITLKSIFNTENYKYIACPIENIDRFIDYYGKWILLTYRNINTADYTKSIETDLMIKVYFLYNPLNGRMVDAVTFSFCKDLKGVGPWSNDGIVLFDDETGTQKELKSFLYRYYELLNGSFYLNDDKYVFSIKGSMMNNTKLISLVNAKANKCINADLAKNKPLDLSKNRALTYALRKILNAPKGSKLAKINMQFVSKPENNIFLPKFNQDKLVNTISTSFLYKK